MIVKTNPEFLQLETDEKNGVPYLVGRCLQCDEHLILKWKGAGKYKCPYCKREFVIRRNR